MEERKYNGWTNYETWCVNLWLSNDEGSYETCRELVESALDSSETDDNGDVIHDRDRIHLAADSLQEFVKELAPDLGPSMFSDMLNSALSEVDWQEIAEAFAEDCNFVEPEAVNE